MFQVSSAGTSARGQIPNLENQLGQNVGSTHFRLVGAYARSLSPLFEARMQLSSRSEFWRDGNSGT